MHILRACPGHNRENSFPAIRKRGEPLTASICRRDGKVPPGGAPGMLVEIVVLSGGRGRFGDVKLGPAGYALVPPGTFAYNLTTNNGARILYYRDNVDPLAHDPDSGDSRCPADRVSADRA